MFRKSFALLYIITIASCSSIKSRDVEVDSEKNYGFSQKNPIKTGHFSPQKEHDYLDELLGPNGEKVFYHRAGHCCEFKTEDSPFGIGALDVYKVTYLGKKDTITLYLNMYEKAALKAPLGFNLKSKN